MVILNTDIVFRLSGGAANADPDLALGGAKSSTALVDNTAENLFSNSLGPESLAGSTKYRCIYVHNAHATLTMLNSKVYITANTPSTDTSMEVAVGTAAINGTEQTIANEDTAPTGVSWGSNSTYATGYALGDIPPSQHKAIWFKRVISASASAYASDTCTFEIGCDSEA